MSLEVSGANSGNSGGGVVEDIMCITPLGSGQEVGRSCHVVEYRGVTILLDCGIHPGYEGLNGLPFLDRLEPERVDVVLISHFHLDHVASLPYFTERTNFNGRIYMTHPTKAVTRLLLGDYLRLLTMRNNQSTMEDDTNLLYNEEELNSCMNKIQLIDYHQQVDLGNGVKFHALNAGHVLGAAMFCITYMGGRTLLYTGDYSMEEDRHLMAAEIPTSVKSVDVLMVESTYGVQVHASRTERESRFTSTVERIVSRGGKCLIPVFALGRAQELLLILDEYWQSNPQLQHIPIWYASKLASRALRVYQTYANMMNERIRKQTDVCNPFAFQYIQNLKTAVNISPELPCVVLASPGMLQSGVSRQLFDQWASDSKNGVVIAGYAVENTLAKDLIVNPPSDVTTLEGKMQPLNCLVDHVSFSAHVDFVQNKTFISKIKPKHIILVHGQKDEMGRLKSALTLQFRNNSTSTTTTTAAPPTISMPPNLQDVKLKFIRRTNAKVMGSLAANQPTTGSELQGILVTQPKTCRIVAPQDVSTYTPLRMGKIQSKLHIPFGGSFSTLQLFLNEMFANMTTTASSSSDSISSGEKKDNHNDVFFGFNDEQVQLKMKINSDMKTIVGGKVLLEWMASPMNDVMADAIVALIMHAQSSTASIRLTSQPCNHRPNKKIKAEKEEEESSSSDHLQLFYNVLKERFQNVQAIFEGSQQATFEINLEDDNNNNNNNCTVTVIQQQEQQSGYKITVECEDNKFAQTVQTCLRNIASAHTPLQP